MDKLVDYLCIIQARINSTRLPAKVMLDLAGKTLLERVVETVFKSKKIGKIIVATSEEKDDTIIAKKMQNLDIDCFRGDLKNVLKRFYDASQQFPSKNIVRITADNPLMDAKVIDMLVNDFEHSKADYAMYKNGVYGLSAEVFTVKALTFAYENAKEEFDKEHVTPYIKNNLSTHIIDIEEKYKIPDLSATVDTLQDYIKMQNFYLYCLEKGLESSIDNYIERYTGEEKYNY